MCCKGLKIITVTPNTSLIQVGMQAVPGLRSQNSCTDVLQVRGLVCVGKHFLDTGALAAVSTCLLWAMLPG